MTVVLEDFRILRGACWPELLAPQLEHPDSKMTFLEQLPELLKRLRLKLKAYRRHCLKGRATMRQPVSAVARKLHEAEKRGCTLQTCD